MVSLAASRHATDRDTHLSPIELIICCLQTICLSSVLCHICIGPEVRLIRFPPLRVELPYTSRLQCSYLSEWRRYPGFQGNNGNNYNYKLDT